MHNYVSVHDHKCPKGAFQTLITGKKHTHQIRITITLELCWNYKASDQSPGLRSQKNRTFPLQVNHKTSWYSRKKLQLQYISSQFTR